MADALGPAGWFCAYVVMTDRDHERVSATFEYDDMLGYPILDVHGGVSFYNKAEDPFGMVDRNPGYAVIEWDYCHEEESENGVS